MGRIRKRNFVLTVMLLRLPVNGAFAPHKAMKMSLRWRLIDFMAAVPFSPRLGPCAPEKAHGQPYENDIFIIRLKRRPYAVSDWKDFHVDSILLPLWLSVCRVFYLEDNMMLGNALVFDESTTFRSLKKDNLTFEQVYEEIISFIKDDPDSSYKISVGTDSQVGSKTVFVSCIHVHRLGKGAIGFLHKSEMARPIRNLREKICLETCASLQLAYMFNDEKINRICQVVGKGDRSKGVSFEFHIDVGTRGQTKALINEMVGMVKGLNFVPKIKPESYCASCFADRYTKAM